MADRQEYMRLLMRKRRQQYREEMAARGTPVIRGRPPLPKPAGKRVELLAFKTAVRLKEMAGNGRAEIGFRELRREATYWFVLGSRKRPPSRPEMLAAIEVCERGGIVRLGPRSARGLPKTIHLVGSCSLRAGGTARPKRQP